MGAASLREIIPDFGMRPVEVCAAHELDHAWQCHEGLHNARIAEYGSTERLFCGGKHVCGSIETGDRVYQIIDAQCLRHHTVYLTIGGWFPDGTNFAAWHAFSAPRTRDEAPATT